MPISDPEKRKEHDRLTKAILRAEKAGKDISKLLAQRQSLISVKASKKRTPNKLKTKSREEINRNYYHRNKKFLQEQAIINKEKKQEREEERHEEKIKLYAEKFYEANSIKVLMSFKEYTALKKGKKLWKNFNWTLQDCEQGVGDIISIMKLRETADNFIRDYWDTAKGKIKEGEQWNLLKPEQQQKLIRYWGREKFRLEKGLTAKLEWQEEGGRGREREISWAKFHEERGKINCSCDYCQERKEIRREVKQRYDDYWQEKEKLDEREEVMSECGNCHEYKKVSVDSGLCRKCERQQEEE